MDLKFIFSILVVILFLVPSSFSYTVDPYCDDCPTNCSLSCGESLIRSSGPPDADWFNYTINYLSHRVEIRVTPSLFGGSNLTAIWVPEDCTGPPSSSNYGGAGLPSSVTNESLPPGT
jgi:hypothetical protein